jgi:hypothetical protein
MKVVKFLQPVTLGTTYNPDEMAGFDDDVAKGLIEQKLAEEVKSKPAVEDKGTETK